MSDDHPNRFSLQSERCLCNLKKRFPQYVSEISPLGGWNTLRSQEVKATSPRNNNSGQIRFLPSTYELKTCEGPDAPNWRQREASAVFLPRSSTRTHRKDHSRRQLACGLVVKEGRKKNREIRDDTWETTLTGSMGFPFLLAFTALLSH